MATEFTPQSRMVARTYDFQKRTGRYIWTAFLVTVLFHLIGGIWVLYSGILQMPKRAEMVRIVPYEKLPEREDPALNVMNEPKELVDVPARLATAERPEEDTPRIADKNALSRNPETVERLPEDDPFSRGMQRDIVVMENAGPLAQHSDPSGGSRILTPRVGGVRNLRESDEIPMWNPDMLLKENYRDGRDHEDKELESAEPVDLVDRSVVVVPLDDLDQRPNKGRVSYEKHKSFGLTAGPGRISPTYDNQFSLAKDFGDFSFSTVAWDYAPYLYELREAIRRHWYPPPAFRMGLLSGRVKVNFKIFPDGHVEDFQFLSMREEYDEGYESLKKSSQNSILASLPFSPLPYDFPDPFLEITGTFYYQILGQDE